MDSPVPEKPPEKPLAEARRRLSGETARRKRDVIVGMAAANVPVTKIAQATLTQHGNVSRILAEEKETVLEIRNRLKNKKIRAVEKINDKLYNRIEKDVETADARDVDALFRAAHAGEKIEAQLSGEGQIVTSKGDVSSQQPHVDLKLLIQQIVGGS